MRGGVYVRARRDRRFKEGVRIYAGQTKNFERRMGEHRETGKLRDGDKVRRVAVPPDKRDRVEAWAIKKFGSYENRRKEEYSLGDRVAGFFKDRGERRRIRDFVEKVKR